MAVKIPLKALCNGSGDTCALSEFQAADFLGVDNGGTGLITQGICEYTRPGCFDSSCGTTFLGVGAGKATLEAAKYNTMIGYCAGAGITTSCDVTLLGHKAGMAITTAALGATLVGQSAGVALTTGTAATYIGYEAGAANSTGILNTFLGYQAGNLATASCNTAVGSSTLVSLTTGIDNTTVGTNTGRLLVSTNNNTFIGSNAGCVATCANNTMVGAFAGRSQTTGCQNTFIGVCAGHDSQGAQGNVIVGFVAGQKITGGTNNVFIGQGAGQCTNNGSNNIYIGEAAGCTQTTKSSFFEVRNAGLTLMNGCFTTGDLTIPNGKVGIGTDGPGDKLDVRGGAIAVYGQNTSHAACVLKFGHEGSGLHQIRAYGVDASTVGKLEITLSASDGSPTCDVMTISEENVVVCGSIESHRTGGGFLNLRRNDGTGTANESLGIIDFISSDASTGSCGTMARIQGAYDSAGDSAKLRFYTGGSTGSGTPTLTEVMTILSGGGIGIGTCAPRGRLHVQGCMLDAMSSIGTLQCYAFVISNCSASGTGGGIAFGNDDGSVVGGSIVHVDQGSAQTGALAFFTREAGGNVTEGLRIDNQQRVGIGTTTPTHKLNVLDTSGSVLRLQGISSYNYDIESQGDGTLWDHEIGSANAKFSWSSSSAELMRLDCTGLGIGTTAPSHKLNVFGCINNGIKVQANTDTDFAPDSGYANDALIIQNSTAGDNNPVSMYFATGSNGEVRLSAIDDATNGDANFALTMRRAGGSRCYVQFWEAGTGNIGIGTAAPANKLHVHDTTNDNGINMLQLFHDRGASNVCQLDLHYIKFMQRTNNAAGTVQARIAQVLESQVHSSRASGLAFYTENAGTVTEKLRINNSGNIGIGTATPAQKLHVHGGVTIQGSGDLCVGSPHFKVTSDGVVTWGDGVDNGVLTWDTGKAVVGGQSGHVLQLNAKGAARATVDDGFFGIGTASNSGFGGSCQQVIINGAANARLEFGIGGSQLGGLYSTADYLALYTSGNDYLSFQTCGTERIRILADGKVGIGTAAPATLLHLQSPSGIGKIQLSDNAGRKVEIQSPDSGVANGRIGTITNHSFEINAGAGGGSNHIGFFIDCSEKVRISNSGQVGIGTTNPSNQLHVKSSGFNAAIIEGGIQTFFYADTAFWGYGDKTAYGGNLWGGHKSNCYLIGYTNGTEKLRIDAEGKTGIGTTTPTQTLHVHGCNSTTFAVPTTMLVHGTAVYNNTYAGAGIGFVGDYNSSGDDTQFATIAGEKENTTDGDYGGALTFHTRANGNLGGERVRITSAGSVGIGTTSPVASKQLDVRYSANCGNIRAGGIYISPDLDFSDRSGYGDMAFLRKCKVTSGGYWGVRVEMLTKPACMIFNPFQYFYNSAGDGAVDTAAFTVCSNGNVVNINNSYGSTSDCNLKMCIVDASSQWDDISQIKVRNYELCSEPGVKRLGIIAQETESISAGLVETSPTLDNNGELDGGESKSVKYSILYMKAVKALQEAMERIETLETKVAALEAA